MRITQGSVSRILARQVSKEMLKDRLELATGDARVASPAASVSAGESIRSPSSARYIRSTARSRAARICSGEATAHAAGRQPVFG